MPRCSFLSIFQWVLAAQASRRQPRDVFVPHGSRGLYPNPRSHGGGSDSVVYCQATVQAMFQEVPYSGLLICLDDLLGCSKSPDGLLQLLCRVLTICTDKGLKLNPNKCCFNQKEFNSYSNKGNILNGEKQCSYWQAAKLLFVKKTVLLQ